MFYYGEVLLGFYSRHAEYLHNLEYYAIITLLVQEVAKLGSFILRQHIPNFQYFEKRGADLMLRYYFFLVVQRLMLLVIKIILMTKKIKSKIYKDKDHFGERALVIRGRYRHPCIKFGCLSTYNVSLKTANFLVDSRHATRPFVTPKCLEAIEVAIDWSSENPKKLK